MSRPVSDHPVHVHGPGANKNYTVWTVRSGMSVIAVTMLASRQYEKTMFPMTKKDGRLILLDMRQLHAKTMQVILNSNHIVIKIILT